MAGKFLIGWGGLKGKRDGTSGIPTPDLSVQSLYSTVVALKQNVERLNGAIGDKKSMSVTFQDLIDLGLIEEMQLPPSAPRKGS